MLAQGGMFVLGLLVGLIAGVLLVSLRRELP